MTPAEELTRLSTPPEELGRDDSGWDALYCDPDDERLWSWYIPKRDSGWRPPQLRCLSLDEARTNMVTPSARGDVAERIEPFPPAARNADVRRGWQRDFAQTRSRHLSFAYDPLTRLKTKPRHRRRRWS